MGSSDIFPYQFPGFPVNGRGGAEQCSRKGQVPDGRRKVGEVDLALVEGSDADEAARQFFGLQGQSDADDVDDHAEQVDADGNKVAEYIIDVGVRRPAGRIDEEQREQMGRGEDDDDFRF